jgi:hypothetical protein
VTIERPSEAKVMNQGQRPVAFLWKMQAMFLVLPLSPNSSVMLYVQFIRASGHGKLNFLDRPFSQCYSQVGCLMSSSINW